MKRLINLSLAALACSLVFTNCAKEIESLVPETPKAGEFEIIASADTKTTNDGLNTKWAANDGINLFHAEAGTSTYTDDGEFSIAAADLETGKFKGTLGADLSADKSYDWYAFYPYSSYITTPANTNAGYTVLGCYSNSAQTQTGVGNMSHLAGSNYPLYGKATGVSASDVPSITMTPAFSVVEIAVKNSTGAALSVSSIEFTAPEDIIGQYYISFSGDNASYTERGSSSVSATAKLTVTEASIATGATAKFYLAVKPFTAASGSELSISVNGYEKKLTLTKDVTFSEGKIKKLSFDYDQKPQVYELITTDGAFVNGGKYVFAIKGGATGDNTYYFINNNGGSNNLTESALTVSADNKITDPGVAYVFEAVTNGTGFSLKNSNGKYINGSAAKINTNSTARCYIPTFLSESNCYKLKDGTRSIRYYSDGTSIRGYADNSDGQPFVDQIATNASLTNQKSGAWYVFKLGGLVTTTDPTISPASVSDSPAHGGVNLTKDIVLSNFTTAPTLTATPDGTCVTAASVSNVTTSGATVTYTLAPNYGSTAKSGTITVSDGNGHSGIITISQLAAAFTVSREEVELNANSGAYAQITVTSDFDWTIDDSSLSGFTVSPNSFTYTDNTKQTVTITATGSNSSASPADLDIFAIVRTADSEELLVTVSQKSAKLATPSLTLTPDAANKKFKVEWTSVPNASKYEYCVLDKAGEYKVDPTQTTDASTRSFEVTGITLGDEYTVNVKAIGDNNPWIDSAEAEETITVKASSSTATISLGSANWTAAADSKSATLTHDVLTMVYSQSESTTTMENGLSSDHIRLHQGKELTITPVTGKSISKLVFTVTENKYATPLKNSTWTNAAATSSGTTVTVTVADPSKPVTVKATAQSRIKTVVVTYE